MGREYNSQCALGREYNSQCALGREFNSRPIYYELPPHLLPYLLACLLRIHSFQRCSGVSVVLEYIDSVFRMEG